MPNTPVQTARTMDLVIGLKELEQVLSTTPENLKRTWLKRHQQYGMPRKHPAGWFWPRKSIDVWLTSQAYVSADPGNDNDGEIPVTVHETRVAEQRAALHTLLGVSK
ncbi:MAG: hypothetical protein JJ856_13655 [Roseibium sp.]|uniref:hypothetical protein n=1 Tax=Roseibium sp. TaxID=1936156 RepID=UPI001B12D086|nr:hypothetical protein [Roseibium sp.]MBO6930613.1 hypothetical protein [Roseibium sp.]